MKSSHMFANFADERGACAGKAAETSTTTAPNTIDLGCIVCLDLDFRQSVTCRGRMAYMLRHCCRAGPWKFHSGEPYAAYTCSVVGDPMRVRLFIPLTVG